MGGGAIPPISQGVSPKQGVPLLTARARSQRRAAVVLVLLSLLLMLGAGGYLAFAAFGKQLSRLGMGQAPVITVNLRLPVTYAGMNVTLLDVQRARNFVDDPWSADNGMVRVRLREQNGTTVPLAWNCAEIVRLLVRGQRAALAPVFLRSPNTLAPGAMQTSLLDFAVPENDALASMHLRLGAANEAQIFIPLTNKANLSQYGAQTRPQHTSTGYFGLNWALLTSTTSLSMPGQQASSGMEYLTLALRVDNPLIQEVITGSPFDYARFKVGNRTFAPVDSTLPVSFASRAQGRTGAITFLIPQKSTAGALLLLSQDAGESGQATANVQIG